MFYTPFHLPHLQIASTIGRARVLNDATVARARRSALRSGRRGQARSARRRDDSTESAAIAPYGLIDNARAARAMDALPMGLVRGLRAAPRRREGSASSPRADVDDAGGAVERSPVGRAIANAGRRRRARDAGAAARQRRRSDESRPLCGGLGTRLRDYDESIPKPMVPIGYRPIMWNLMKYYAHYGHKEFVLCLGHKADVIKQYFVDYNECLSNDFVMARGRQEGAAAEQRHPRLDASPSPTPGLSTSIGERLAARSPVTSSGDEIFLANYSDCLTDLDLDQPTSSTFKRSGRIAGFVTVAPSTSYHYVESPTAW